ncbi:MAG: hypothetical protein FJZ61_03575 [Chlamydiae bacterium]|nr:hypothetical protein [Chlamydiota bacterium]
MRAQNEINKAQREVDCYTADSEPFLEWNAKLNEKTGEHESVSIELSDGSTVDRDSIKAALKRTTGTADVVIGEKILNKVARGMTGKKRDLRMTDASTLLAALRPKDETEAMLKDSIKIRKQPGKGEKLLVMQEKS